MFRPRKSCRFLMAFCTFVGLLPLVQMVFTGSGEVRENQFMKVTRCPGRVVAAEHRYRTVGGRSVLDCVAQCRPDSGCLSVFFDSSSRHCHLMAATSALDCRNMEPAEPNIELFEAATPCPMHEETLGPEGVCVCDQGFRGTPCQPYIGDCEEAYANGKITGNGVYFIHPLQAPQPFPVMCKEMLNNSRTYVLDRKDHNEDFRRNFQSYRNGFGNVSGDHWLGLEKIHLLTASKPYEFRVSIRILNGTSYFQQYVHFVLSDAASGYRFSFNYTVPDTLLGDCLTPLLGASFSTFDNDQDESETVNCAAKHEGGFWFRGDSCSTCNPTGPLMLPANGIRYGVDNEAFWKNNLGNLALFKVSMFLVAL